MAAGAGRPGAPGRGLPGHVADQKVLPGAQLRPRLDRAVAGRGHVLFADAAHVPYGTYLCPLWSRARVPARAASGRQRFNALGAWGAVTRAALTVASATAVSTGAMRARLRAVAARGYAGPVTPALDSARHQRSDVAKGRAEELGIELPSVPPHSPNSDPIERPWRFTQRTATSGKCHPTFAAFRAAAEDVLARISTEHADQLAPRMARSFQELDDGSLLAA